MLHYALRNDRKMFVAPLEARVPGVAYTVDTLQRLRRELTPDTCQLYLVVGADSLGTFSQWKDYKRIPELADLIPVARPGASDIVGDQELVSKLTTELGEGVVAKLLHNVVPYSGAALSSSEIRAQLKEGETQLPIHPDVYRYSSARGLYI